MEKFRELNWCIVLLSVMLFTGCTSVMKVHTEHDKNVDFTKYKTFSFYGFTDKTSGMTELNRNRIITAITAEMIAHGFKQVDADPDIFVNATTILKEKSQVSNT